MAADSQRAEQAILEFHRSYEFIVSALTIITKLARSMLLILGINKPSRGPQWSTLAKFDLGFLTSFSEYGLTHSVIQRPARHVSTSLASLH